MSRKALSVSSTEQELRELERLSNSRTDEVRLVERAKIIIRCLSGKRNDEIAKKLNMRPGTVAVWRKRFATEGLKGLRDRQRSGKPPLNAIPELPNRLLEQIEQPPPDGQAIWDGGSLAKALGISADRVWRLLRKEGSNSSVTAHGASALILSFQRNPLILSVYI